MLDPVDTRFFSALQQVLAAEEGAAAAACRAAVAQALATGAPLDLRAARAQIETLAPERRDAVLARVHATMARDLSAIWDQLPHAPGPQRPN